MLFLIIGPSPLAYRQQLTCSPVIRNRLHTVTDVEPTEQETSTSFLLPHLMDHLVCSSSLSLHVIHQEHEPFLELLLSFLFQGLWVTKMSTTGAQRTRSQMDELGPSRCSWSKTTTPLSWTRWPWAGSCCLRRSGTGRWWPSLWRGRSGRASPSWWTSCCGTCTIRWAYEDPCWGTGILGFHSLFHFVVLLSLGTWTHHLKRRYFTPNLKYKTCTVWFIKRTSWIHFTHSVKQMQLVPVFHLSVRRCAWAGAQPIKWSRFKKREKWTLSRQICS